MTTRREFLRTSTAAGAALCMPGLAWGAGAGVARLGSSASTWFEWREIARGVFATGGLATGGNAMLVAGRRSAILIDAKMAALGPTLLAEARELAGKRTELTTLVNTHHHADHTGGNVAFAGEVAVVAQQKCKPRVVDQFERYQSQLRNVERSFEGQETEEAKAALARAEALAGKVDTLTSDDWVPTETIDAYHRIDIGRGLSAQLHHAGAGHTDNDVFVRIPERNVIHAGDLVFHELHPFFDPNGGVDSAGWIDSLNRLLSMCDDETVVVPGHGEVTDAQGVQKQIQYIESLRAEVGRAIDAGKTVDEIAQMTWPFMDGLGFEQIRPNAIRVVHAELSAAPGG